MKLMLFNYFFSEMTVQLSKIKEQQNCVRSKFWGKKRIGKRKTRTINTIATKVDNWPSSFFMNPVAFIFFG